MISATRYRAAAEISRQTALAEQIAKLQESVSTGKRLTKPSDDPTASARVSEIRQIQAGAEVYARNINTGAAIAKAADGKLTSVADLIDRAKELVIAGRSETASPEDRAALAAELRQLTVDIDTYASASDPVGNPLFPDGDPLNIPVSDTLRLPATASRAEVFDEITTANGTKSLKDIINDAADALESTDAGTLATQAQAGLDELDAAATHIISVRSDQGVRGQRFDYASDQLTAIGDQLTIERSSLEDTDLTTALAEFQAKQLSLQAAQTVFAQSNRSTLFDLLG